MNAQIGNVLTQGSNSPTDERPRFGKKQIRQVCQIHKGGRIRVRSTGGYSQVIKITRGPYKEDGRLKVDFEFYKDSKPWTGSILLEDYSVIRDSKKEWDPYNWLEKV